ncbi:cupin domain-containing protein [Natrinema salaciae]|uniref:Mannose-6-phosphate isomerase, cupin superfamily n=1 Tax=Natrinema salaciae TaxID=1186196 RepID=A0A1H9BRZ6_9EURY|nr:cupin domain-containing protein [Natrinema salaciae]SEP91726.1 Mannose-6-phosphate isomerase, cupin superfamily [Natrinema salaciae]
MEHVAIDDVEPTPVDDYHADVRALTDPLATDDVAVTRYVLEPGERFSGSVHTHMDQEAVFVVLAGEATFERPEDRITVQENEAVRFGPGEFQSGKNDGEEPVVALAIGAPRESDDVRISRIETLDRDISCPECDTDHMRIAQAADADFVCPACEATTSLE